MLCKALGIWGEKMRINTIVIGQSWLASEVIKGLVAIEGVNMIGAVVEQPGDRFDDAAKSLKVPTLKMPDTPHCDLMVAAHCHSYLPEYIRGRSRLGVLAYHPSLLPRHRGKDAVPWTIAMRDPIAGGTVFWMDGGIDTGPVQGQEFCFVGPTDTAATLWRRSLGPMGVRLITDNAKGLVEGRLPGPVVQDERFATYEPPAPRNLLPK